jgi:hypothetical protein
MANSDVDSDRYIVIGYAEKAKTFHDVKANKNRRNLEDLNDLIKKNNFNYKPIIDVQNIILNNSITLDIIIIKNGNKKPYFLTVDKTESILVDNKQKQKTIRAGVVYTRDGPTNTPIDSTAADYQIEKMWKERFCINLSPLERFEIFIHDTENWITPNGYTDNNIVYHYKQFPEFTIEFGDYKETTCSEWEVTSDKQENNDKNISYRGNL